MHLLLCRNRHRRGQQWDAAARANQTFENIYALPRLHALFARHGVRPTYVITYPVATDARSAEVLRGLRERQRLRDWRAPPCLGDTALLGRGHPAASLRLHPAAAAVRGAARRADRAIDAAIGARPLSYRSGRFGFSAEHTAALERRGYQVESSVAPLFYEAHKGGPDFVEAPLRHTFSPTTAPSRAGLRRVLEVPFRLALNRRLPKPLQHASHRLPEPLYGPSGILRALRLLRARAGCGRGPRRSRT